MTTEASLFAASTRDHEPLAHRMRPNSLDSFLGQEHLLGLGKPLREAIEHGAVGSMVFWGPPGCGKTTLALLIAHYTNKHFETFSAVTEGVPRVREIIAEARDRLATEGRGTILFCDEIHRFNKAQQDAFLPHVEAGTITLIGATTENPSFELNSALLSRMRVFVLEPISQAHLREIVANAARALAAESGAAFGFDDTALDLLAVHADGDARRALNATEAVWNHVRTLGAKPEAAITAALVATALERRVARFDKSGEEHFNQISALHKSVRGSDVEGALYWLARMLAGGEDPMYLLRRLVRMATEDIGLSDPHALSITLAAKDAYHFLGSPEGELALAEATVYLATAPKSNSVYRAWGEARAAAETYPAEPVPLHIRNAPTRLMQEIGYGKGYRYDHDEGGFAAGQRYLPDALHGARWYRPTDLGYEKTLGERLEWWAKLKKAAAHE
jgi:putative ATPase